MTTGTKSISFDNTEIAFAAQSDGKLKKSNFLFWLMNNPILVNTGSSLAQLSFKLKLPVKRLVKQTLFSQFCGGENIEDCSSTVKTLQQYNIGTILDYAVEGTKNEASFDHTCQEIIATDRKSVV